LEREPDASRGREVAPFFFNMKMRGTPLLYNTEKRKGDHQDYRIPFFSLSGEKKLFLTSSLERKKGAPKKQKKKGKKNPSEGESLSNKRKKKSTPFFFPSSKGRGEKKIRGRTFFSYRTSSGKRGRYGR